MCEFPGSGLSVVCLQSATSRHSSCRPSRPHSSRSKRFLPERRRHILIHPEQVRGIEFRLKCSQPRKLFVTVSCPHAVDPFITDIVHVGCLGCEGPNGLEELPRPENVLPRVR